MVSQLKSNVSTLPEIEGVARNVKNTHVIWVSNNEERHILPVDQTVVKMIKGGMEGMWNELAFPYINDKRTESSEGKKLAKDIMAS